ncbi:MAG: hypothetical protein QNJ77_02320 [Acidimicrobiia bacterium]|nr:hypothetical protein [Acidimicrobiia bacterium]
MLRRMIPIAVALLLVVSACGDGDVASTTPTLPSIESPAESQATTTTTEAVDPEEAFQEYTQCMREHGIDMPDPSSGSGGVIEIEGDGEDLMLDGAFEEAAAQCDPILEAAFGEFDLSPEQEAEMMDQELALAQCMRAEGIDWPDPSGDGNVMIELGESVDPEAIDTALDKCIKEAFGDTGGLILEGETS